MLDRIQSVIDNSGLSTKVYIKDLRLNRDLVDIGSDDEVGCKELIYVPVLLSTCSLIYDRKITIKDEIQVSVPQGASSYLVEDAESAYRLDELLKIMIIMNDTPAAINILKHIGPAKVNEFLVNEGFKATQLGNTSVTTMKEMGTMFEKTFKRRFISPRMCDFALDLLHRTRNNDMLTRLILEDVKFAQFSDCTKSVANACSVVLCKDTEYFIGVSVSGASDEEDYKKLIGKISRIVYETLNQPETV